MEHHHFSGKTHYQWPFSIVGHVRLPGGISTNEGVSGTNFYCKLGNTNWSILTAIRTTTNYTQTNINLVGGFNPSEKS